MKQSSTIGLFMRKVKAAGIVYGGDVQIDILAVQLEDAICGVTVAVPRSQRRMEVVCFFPYAPGPCCLPHWGWN